MLFNNLVPQSGGGTYTNVNADLDWGRSLTVTLPDSATLVCLSAWCNGAMSVVYGKSNGKFTLVANHLSTYYISMSISGNIVTISNTSGSTQQYASTGTLFYK